MQLYEINQNGNRYCGPSAVSAIAGIGTKEAAALMRQHSRKTAIKGSHLREVAGALVTLGFAVSHSRNYQKQGRVTLRQWAKSNARGDAVYLVAAGNHWILLQGRHAICGKTKNFVAVADHPNARAFVTESSRIALVRKVDPAAVIPKPPPNPNAPTANEARARRKANQLALEYGIELERMHPGRGWTPIGVWPPEAISEDEDEHEGDHWCDDWIEILERVEKYAKLLAAKAQTA